VKGDGTSSNDGKSHIPFIFSGGSVYTRYSIRIYIINIVVHIPSDSFPLVFLPDTITEKYIIFF
jgi:hypothetical protein